VSAQGPEAIVVGRLAADLYPEQHEVPLEDVSTFRRFVGGFAGNVCFGLARLGVRTAIVSAVGDDGHGRYLRRELEAEGVDCRFLGVHPSLRTALTFCEVWPPDRFPITFYRTPTCPDWEIGPDAVDAGAVRAAGLVYVSGTGLAVEPSRGTTMAILEARGGREHTILDLDWRAELWSSRDAYAAAVAAALPHATTILGGDAEWEAAGLDPASDLPATRVVKHGPHGVTVHAPGGAAHDAPGLPVPVVNGLGAGDAFGAAYGYALLRDLPPAPLANAAGAIVATRLSCSAATPRRDELHTFLERHTKETA
jgi:5-dehydro-2-deoxygluconokinase